MSQAPHQTGHGIAARPAASPAPPRQHMREPSSRAEPDAHGSMASSPSSYPSLSPSPENTSDDASSSPSPAPALAPASASATAAATTAAADTDTESDTPPEPAPGLAAAVPRPSGEKSAPPADPSSGLAAGALGPGADGLADRLFHPRSRAPVAAIFIHAGAGFHSKLNEHVHLEACSDAARMGMKLIMAGGTAVDAIEAAIKCLEDKEITNAGFGSNLSIKGVVEGDATIVDHLGRSGACGATQMIKNPISLARLIYERSNFPLSLRRIPPNFLVGPGATRFAQEHGMRIVPHQTLISKGAQDRFLRWRQDLINAENAATNRFAAATLAATTAQAVTAAPPRSGAPQANTDPGNEEPVSNDQLSKAAAGQGSPRDRFLLLTEPVDPKAALGMMAAPAAAAMSAPASPAFLPRRTAAPLPKRRRVDSYTASGHDEAAARRRLRDSSGDGSHGGSASEDMSETVKPAAVSLDEAEAGPAAGSVFAHAACHDSDTDLITDTIGAIAIDLRGNVAAGSSSGGIGMKHSGRVGPAALVGIGTAVMPSDPKDSNGTCTAAVMSGTGEQMATTMASHTCADRLYRNMRRAPGGALETEWDDDNIMKSFVTDDFMNHPGVRNQIPRAALGVMAVKKTNKGVYFYFAHNTDSFALASMSSSDPDPLVVMSRLGPKENVARGGRKIKRR